ncbi:MAG: TlpA family protein disulfide reductase [Bacteroides sp.]|nr:TlpA family protein disulfide reductase [Bacteroides sp.]
MMKNMLKAMVLGALVASCTPREENGVSIHLQKRAGEWQRYGLMNGFSQKDTVGIKKMYPDVKVAPKGWTDVTYHYGTISSKQALYQSYRQGIFTKEECMEWFDRWEMDTANYSPQPLKTFITAAIGINEQKDTCIVFDSNVNLDLSDDTPMLLSDQHPMPVYIERWINGRIVPDSTYVYQQTLDGNSYLRFSEIVEQKVLLKDKEYTCRIEWTSPRYEHYSIINIQFIAPDTTYKYRVGQYANLADTYYIIDSLSIDGRYLHLTEVLDAQSKETMQIGFRPYSFTATTMAGDSIRFPDDFKGKYVLLDFWATSCGPCVQEIDKTYPSAYEKYKDKGFEILAVANNTSDQINRFMEKHPMPWMHIADHDQDRKLQKQFNISGFPTLYLIGPDGKVCATENSLRLTMLEETLKKYLGE